MLVSYTYRITELRYTYVNATLSADYVGYLYFENYWFTPHIWVSNLKGSQLASSTYRITKVDYS